ncbi:MAG: N-6 DNA methylase [Anaerolineae bacterium]|nr:N-6 DNA methylase [Anaerolineae bacterium]
MVAMLDVQADSTILEPSAGNGAFIAALIGSGRSIEAYELDSDAIAQLHKTFGTQIQVIHGNTLLDSRLTERIVQQGGYDRIIANPPYGAWLDYEQRKILKRAYPDFYVKETYALFLYRCVQLLNDSGKLVFIVPDTWLNLHRHTALRKYLLEKTTLLEIALFPSAFFPRVNFGYANLCILTVQKGVYSAGHEFNVYTGFRDVSQLADKDTVTCYRIQQHAMQSNLDHALFISDKPKVMRLINDAPLRVGDIAACVTGFYSGNDKHFLKTRLDKKRYAKIDPDTICQSTDRALLADGLEGNRCYVPIAKGGAQHYIKPDDWFMLWSKEAVEHYRHDKKARYQNAGYYFRQGLGVPMVSSSKITAALLNYRLFDQSIVGIFPHNAADMGYLLAFFNSPTCNTLIRTINPSANNSAKYICKLPFLRPAETQSQTIQAVIKTIIQQIASTGQFDFTLKTEVDNVIGKIYGF